MECIGEDERERGRKLRRDAQDLRRGRKRLIFGKQKKKL